MTDRPDIAELAQNQVARHTDVVISYFADDPRKCICRPCTLARAVIAQQDEIARLRHIGAQMSNVCFNLGQSAKSLNEHERALITQLATQWAATTLTPPQEPRDA